MCVFISDKCKCPAIPLKDFTVRKDGCFNSTYRYECTTGYTRKPGTSSLIRCQEKNGVLQWTESLFKCIRKILLFVFRLFKRDLYHVSAKRFIFKDGDLSRFWKLLVATEYLNQCLWEETKTSWGGKQQKRNQERWKAPRHPSNLGLRLD